MQFNSNMMKWGAGITAIIIFFVAAVLLPDWNKQLSPNRDDAKLKELQELASSTPIYPGFYEVSVGSSSRAINAGIYKSYKSSAVYSDVKKFYSDFLLKNGWVISEEKNLDSLLMRNDEWRELTFGKKDYLISVEYKGQGANLQWNYSVSFVWLSKHESK